MSSLQVFHFEGHEVHVLDRDGNPWWIGDEAGKLLGYANVPDAINKHVRPKHKGIAICDTLGGPQEKLVISEAGLYSLIMRSKKPEAERFQDWVFEVVLPAIRKTGSYGPPCESDPWQSVHRKLAGLEAGQRELSSKLESAQRSPNSTLLVPRKLFLVDYLRDRLPTATKRMKTFFNREVQRMCEDENVQLFKESPECGGRLWISPNDGYIVDRAVNVLRRHFHQQEIDLFHRSASKKKNG